MRSLLLVVAALKASGEVIQLGGWRWTSYLAEGNGEAQQQKGGKTSLLSKRDGEEKLKPARQTSVGKGTHHAANGSALSNGTVWAGVLLAKVSSKRVVSVYGAFAMPPEGHKGIECSYDRGGLWEPSKGVEDFRPGAGRLLRQDESAIDWASVFKPNVGLSSICGDRACVHGVRVDCRLPRDLRELLDQQRSFNGSFAPLNFSISIRGSATGVRRASKWTIHDIAVRQAPHPLSAEICAAGGGSSETSSTGSFKEGNASAFTITVVMPYLYPGSNEVSALAALMEWIAWYKLLGANRLLLFDQQLSAAASNFSCALDELALSEPGLVVLRGWWSPRLILSRRYQVLTTNLALDAIRGCSAAKSAACTHDGHGTCRSGAEWVLSLDLDEFIYPVPARQAPAFGVAKSKRALRPWRVGVGAVDEVAGALAKLASGQLAVTQESQAGDDATRRCAAPSLFYFCRVDYFTPLPCSTSITGEGGTRGVSQGTGRSGLVVEGSLETTSLRVGPRLLEEGPSSTWSLWGSYMHPSARTELRVKWMVDVSATGRFAHQWPRADVSVHHVGLPSGACHAPMPLELMHLRHVNRMTRGDKCDPDRSRAFLAGSPSNESSRRKVDFGSLVIRSVPGSLNAEVTTTMTEGRKHGRVEVLKSVIDFGQLAQSPAKENSSASEDPRVKNGRVRPFRLSHGAMNTAASTLSDVERAAAAAFRAWLAEGRLPSYWLASLKATAQNLIQRAQSKDVCSAELVW
eukprot:CAMPEP_0119362362 /NCGR_PEP_ID=MMETSP1334-20130426/9438_1 /TAXON_ID=127549 /ORGANISM="Calcidiscus leptoporus, Strain RCC1130" /LENGTH=745 /DNA_ID=CAMNT_0007377565 /DNA_START=1 /DNA_END=2235 /DNA_ORIENTATION=+